MPEKRIVIIMNPASSRGATQNRKAKVQAIMDNAIAGKDTIYEILETTASGKAIATGEHVPGSGAFLAAKAVADGATVVVAAGGDGTVGEVANGLVGTGIPLGILPMGTGNDFARTIGLGTDLELAVRTLVQGLAKDVDLGKGPGGYFINIAGCGFDAEVAHRINHGIRRLRGTSAYLGAVVQTLATMKSVPIILTVDGTEHRETVMLCAVANAKMYGGGMRIAPDADIADGLFDIVLVGNVGKFEFLKAFPSVFKGNHLQHPKVKVLRGSKVKIEADNPMPVLADGEELDGWPIEFDIVSSALQVMMPPLTT